MSFKASSFKLQAHPSLDQPVMSFPSANYPPVSTPPAITPPTGLSPTKARDREHTISDTRLHRSLAARERRDVLPVNSFQETFLNVPDAMLMTKIAQEVSALVSKVGSL